MERKTISDPDDETGVLGIFLGHFDNGTGLTEDELYARQVKNQQEVNYLLDEAWRSGYVVGHKDGLFNLTPQPGQSPYAISKWIETQND